jgi:phosphoribosylformylglycinamidine cyclo-ligase
MPSDAKSTSTTSGPTPSQRGLTYASAGVDIDRKDAFTEGLDVVLRRTFTPRVIPNPGGFAGLVRLDFNHKLFARNYKEPVLVACCDGVGTKVKLAADLGVFDTVGFDLVGMNVNDLVVQGAEPLLFLDYIATPTLEDRFLHALVRGIAEACKRSGCALIGGETAHMPDLYKKGDFDLAGFCVGVVELKRVQRPARVQAGDVILGLASDGIHSNGYTLVRKIVSECRLDLQRVYEDSLPTKPSKASRRSVAPSAPSKRSTKQAAPAVNAREQLPTLGQVLLTPTRLYADPIVRLMRSYSVKNVVTGMAHTTGSGMEGNLCRALPPTLDAKVDRASWPVLPVFKFLQAQGRVPEEEMWRVFNMGIGYCVIVKPAFAEAVAERLRGYGESVYTIGEVVRGTGKVVWK